MNKKIIILVMVVCLLALAGVMAFSQTGQNVRWEYTTMVSARLTNNQTIERANQLGREGWELVASSHNNIVGDYLIFKRKLP